MSYQNQWQQAGWDNGAGYQQSNDGSNWAGSGGQHWQQQQPQSGGWGGNSSGGSWGGAGGFGGGYGGGDESCMRFDVPNSVVGRIIGKGGSKIKELQDQSGAKIKVLGDQQHTNSAETPVELRGSTDAVKNAKFLIDKLVTDSQFGGSGGYGGGRGGGGFGGGRGGGFGTGGNKEETTTIMINSSDVGRLIGKGGCKIRELQEQSGARIKVLGDDAKGPETPVELQGSLEARNESREMIEQFLSS